MRRSDHGPPSEVVESVNTGDILAGKYRVDRVLGEGGMGVVAAAWHKQLEQRVAIKFLLPEALDSEQTLARFSREARAAVKIRSEHVARVIDVGNLETGAPYMVMEYLEGSDLSARLKSDGPLPIQQAVEFVLHACDAVAEAHGYGIIHRDLKPSNLFVITRPDGTEAVKVLDFGISKTKGAADKGMTSTHQMMGSPFYMSPEQMRSARGVDHRTDIWSLGVILFELLTGTYPFDGDTIPDLFANIINTPARLLRQVRPDAPQGLEAVISRCLQKDPDQRFTNVAELTAALSPFGPVEVQSIVGRISRVVGLSSMPPPAPTAAAVPQEASGAGAAPATKTSWSETGRGQLPKSRPWLIGLSVVAALVLAASALVFAGILRRGGEPAPSAEPAAAGESAALPAYQDVPLPELIAAPAPAPRPSASANAAPQKEPSVAPSRAKRRTTSHRSAPVEVTPVPAAAPTPVPAPRPPAAKPAPPRPKPPSNPLNIGLK